jgi:hypothetical protein
MGKIIRPRIWVGTKNYGDENNIQRESGINIEIEGIFYKETYSETHFYIGRLEKIRYLMPEKR